MVNFPRYIKGVGMILIFTRFFNRGLKNSRQSSVDSRQVFDEVVIVGLGLIGGSVARVCRERKIAGKILAYDIDGVQLEYALNNGIIDGIYNFEELKGNVLVVIATPLSLYLEVAKKLAKKIDDGVIITDVGSLKYFVLEQISVIFEKNDVNFIPAHPIAGSEKSGIASGSADLFLDKKLILTPAGFTNKLALKKLQLFWKIIGSKVILMDAKEHDKIFALVSHLPQMLAFENKEDANDDAIIKQHLRLQNSNYNMWQDIFRLNKANLDYYNRIYGDNLREIKTAIAEGSSKRALEFFKNARKVAKRLGIKQQNFSGKDHELIKRRVIIAASYIQLPDIYEFHKHAGTGFRDFTAVLAYLDFVIDDFV